MFFSSFCFFVYYFSALDANKDVEEEEEEEVEEEEERCLFMQQQLKYTQMTAADKLNE